MQIFLSFYLSLYFFRDFIVTQVDHLPPASISTGIRTLNLWDGPLNGQVRQPIEPPHLQLIEPPYLQLI